MIFFRLSNVLVCMGLSVHSSFGGVAACLQPIRIVSGQVVMHRLIVTKPLTKAVLFR